MKKLYFFTMLSIMLLAVTGAMAQKKTKFKVAELKRNLATLPLCVGVSRCSGRVETQ